MKLHNIVWLIIVLVAISIALLAGVVAHRPLERWLGFKTGQKAAPNVLAAAAAGSQAANAPARHRPAKRRILYYWDPMLGPSSIRSKPGISAMGMQLVPVYAGTTPGAGGIGIDPAMVQDMGIRTRLVHVGLLKHTIRTVGYVRAAAPDVYAETLKVGGYLESLAATTVGTVIGKGDKLFTLYSPKLLAAEEELIAAEGSVAIAKRAKDSAMLRSAQTVAASVRRRLMLWDVSAGQIDQIIKTGKPIHDVTFYSPADGVLMQVNVTQRSPVSAGQTLLTIANLSTVWLDARVYASQLPWIAMNELVTAHIASSGGKAITGKIFYISPTTNGADQTTTVRIALSNVGNLFRPGMYATVRISGQPLKDAVIVPREAVIDTGPRQVAFIETTPHHFALRRVQMGLRGDDGLVQILSGLKPGERVVTSGEFLVDVETRLREAAAKFALQRGTAPAEASR
ncbi:MAG: efflux RND transporter periplasmic adaptor subunit [Phycisphaerales bacterium]|nr:efflux RND transporter periplasmic adaptor subunit [Phycisphaerales bacterium]